MTMIKTVGARRAAVPALAALAVLAAGCGTQRVGEQRADSFGGYPDHAGCEVPSGGH
ncbi:hypothetical protein [Kitasatospora sp. NPDC087314]|uniref:hypothetical protein n=1 Tax=Kitasatospora sp. NPDC087314 TaxID=3364068 RepID=UPI0037FB4167